MLEAVVAPGEDFLAGTRADREVPRHRALPRCPGRAAVHALEQAGGSRGEQVLAVRRIDRQVVEPNSDEGRARAHVPGRAAVKRTQQSRPQPGVEVALAGARVHRLWIGRIEREGAGDQRGLLIGAGEPRLRIVPAFPHPAARRADQNVHRISGIDRDRRDTARDSGPAPDARAIGLAVGHRERPERSPAFRNGSRWCRHRRGERVAS